ncbi:MAG: GNAT family N-acetyltransferase [Pseudomonadota bacterium]
MTELRAIDGGGVIPTFEAGRLRYRAPHIGDFDAFHAFGTSPRSVGVGGPFPHRHQTFDRMAKLVGHWHLRGFGRWVIADRNNDEPLGVVGPLYPEGWPEPEIAWTVFEAAEGRGIAQEAARFTRQYAYDTLGWTTAISMTTKDNTRSIALARRLGAVRDGVFDFPGDGPLLIWRHPGPEALP